MSWFSRVQKFPYPMFFPQEEPDPWVGYSLTEWLTSFLSFARDSNNMVASSSLVTEELTARSGRPTSPKKRVSPVNRHC